MESLHRQVAPTTERQDMSLREIPVFYCESMVANIESFSPSAGKPRDVVHSWQALGIPLNVQEPIRVSLEQFSLAHDPSYVKAVLACEEPNGFGNRSPEVAASLPLTTGAMLSAANAAIENGLVAVAPCSGFHHAGFDYGYGFCTFNGLVVVVEVLRAAAEPKRVGILDCDLHFGDGTVQILKTLGRQDDVPHYTAGEHLLYARQAEDFLKQLPGLMDQFRNCDVLLYQAGADPHIDDPFEGWMTTEQMEKRDLIVFETAKAMGLPIAWNLAGGYQTPLRRVLDIHDNTLKACAQIYLE